MDWNVTLAIISFSIGLVLLLHHGWKHWNEPPPNDAQAESCVWVCYFQLKDIMHFETWAFVCLANALMFALLSPLNPWFHILSGLLCMAGLVFLLISSEQGFSFQHVRNHETWILVCFTCTITLLL